MDFISNRFAFRPGERCIVIGEIGVNHNGSEEILFRLIDEGAKAGLDVVKLQRFNSALEISEHAALADYQSAAGMRESQLKMAQALELPDELLAKAFEYCKRRKIGFLCTAFEHESVDFLARLGCKSIKVPSPEISNKPLLQHMARSFESLLVSTGASYLDEVGLALRWIREAEPSRELALMHCTSQYPTPIAQANLKAIPVMRAAFGLPVGYSDHTLGITAATVSAGLGAAMIEKHYTLDRNMPGPDHQASVEIAELAALVRAVRDASASLGDGIKVPVSAESETRPKIRKSLVIQARGLPAGTALRADMLEIKRPWVPGAVDPADLEKVLGATLKADKRHDEPLLWKDLFGN
jgi:N,N'-diacetyllegionaminate synthase